MNGKGIERILTLFKDDIKTVTYTQDGITKERNDFKAEIKNNTIDIYLEIKDKEQGTFENFQLISKNDIVYSDKELEFKKGNDLVIIEFEFEFSVKEE